jgi:TfoX/Sxy family transcriptional regulator of competence genes
MAWIKVPPEHHPLFRAALPADPRVETQQMFGGVAARVNGHIFAGLFGRSTMLLLPEPDRATALALEGAELFDPMGNGRVMSDKVMLPESMMDEPEELRSWIARAFHAAVALPAKAAKKAAAKKAPAKKAPEAKKAPAKKAAAVKKVPAVKKAPAKKVAAKKK